MYKQIGNKEKLINEQLINLHNIKPLDKQLIIKKEIPVEKKYILKKVV